MNSHTTKRLRQFDPDRESAVKELEEYRVFLSSKEAFTERDELLDFFQKHKQLIALLGCLHEVRLINRIGWEFDIFGAYKADFVSGDSRRCSYCFIEFQDATRNSIFRGERANGIWAHSFEEGFGQIIDWAYELVDNEGREEFDNRFEAKKIVSTFVVVVGRTCFLNKADYKRFDWRRRHITLGGYQIKCLTFDELFEEYENLINFLPVVAEADKTSESKPLLGKSS